MNPSHTGKLYKRLWDKEWNTSTLCSCYTPTTGQH